MPAAVLHPPLVDHLPRTPASDVKRLGWRGVMRTVGREGRILVTNHDRPEAVILSPQEYDRLLRAAQASEANEAQVLDALRDRFDERLAALAQPDAADRLRGVLARPARLQGRVRAGQSH